MASACRGLELPTKPLKPSRGSGARKPLGSPEPRLAGPDEGGRRLSVIEETLQVGKRAVDRGGYRLTKRVETHEQPIEALLRSEHVEIERRPMNIPITDGRVPAIRQEGDTLIVPVIEETLVTVKRLVLLEEVRVTRTSHTRRQAQTVTLRKEHIEVERLAAEPPSKAKAS